MNKKVLIITYYWPPAGGPGVQRVLKFAKYLPEFGWDPIILTVKKGDYPAIDETLIQDIPQICKVFKTKSLEPTTAYKKFVGLKPNDKIPTANLAQKNISWKKKISNWIRLNIFIPDAKIGWIPYAVKEGKRIIREEKPDIIFSSSPPPTVHLIAKKLAKWSGIKWVADFRDPWTDLYHYDSVKRTIITKWIDKKLEKKVICKANEIIVVSKTIGKYLLKDNFPNKNVNVITNGFDKTDFTAIDNSNNSENFVIAYAGKMNVQQNPKKLWETIGRIKKENSNFAKDLEIRFIGNISNEIIIDIKENGIESNLDNLAYLPHESMLKVLSKSTILLLIIPNTKKNKGIITGKIFEYLAINKYILGIGPVTGDASEILTSTNSGKMFEFYNISAIEESIITQYKKWQNQQVHKPNKEEISKYSRKSLTKKLANIFTQCQHNA